MRRFGLLLAAAVSSCSRAPAEEYPASLPVVREPTRAVSSAAVVQPSQVPGCPVDPEPGTHPLPLVHVTFSGGAGAAIDAELARSSHDSERGLMYRTSMAENRGMYFDLGERADHRFWMHNTCLSLDLIYVDDGGVIVGIAKKAPILSDESISVGAISVSVIEVNAGWADRHGVREGQRVSVDLPPR